MRSVVVEPTSSRACEIIREMSYRDLLVAPVHKYVSERDDRSIQVIRFPSRLLLALPECQYSQHHETLEYPRFVGSLCALDGLCDLSQGLCRRCRGRKNNAAHVITKPTVRNDPPDESVATRLY